MGILVAPSILAGDFVNMQKSIELISKCGGDLVHCDVMDGVYVNNITFGMPMITAIRKITKLPLDVHLMITKPERYVEEFIDAGADYITFHPDASDAPKQTLKRIRAMGKKAGIVLNPNIAFNDYQDLLFDSDLILIMSVYAGRGGQKFIPDTLNKVLQAREFIEKHNLGIPIEIDGGINESNALDAVSMGVSILVAGSSVYNSSDPARTISKLKQLNN
ncbi:MAG: ribulose-phosphate 3-epimerase [Christensenellaceae bacterium]|jgi:ribulose-phosphate 3-epimerase|nr:ribulose-phosphate 3-epimerase [Christensenellaceae bacterium]